MIVVGTLTQVCTPVWLAHLEDHLKTVQRVTITLGVHLQLLPRYCKYFAVLMARIVHSWGRHRNRKQFLFIWRVNLSLTTFSVTFEIPGVYMMNGERPVKSSANFKVARALQQVCSPVWLGQKTHNYEPLPRWIMFPTLVTNKIILYGPSSGTFIFLACKKW